MLNEGLPKPDPKVVIEEIKLILFDEANFRKFFPESRKKNTWRTSHYLIEITMIT